MLQRTPSGTAKGCMSQGHETWLLGAHQIIPDDMHTESRPGRVAQRVACRPGLKLVLRLQIHAKADVSQALSDPKAEAGYLELVPSGAPNHAAPRFPPTCLLCSV